MLSTLLARAFDAFDRRDWRDAYGYARGAARLAPEHPGVHYIAGVAALQLGHAPLAVAHLQRITQPERIDAASQLARALAECHRLQEARDVADTLMRRDDLDAATLDTLGTVYTRAHAHDRAAEAFERAARLAPGSADYRFDLATSLMYFGDIDGAEANYLACLRNDWRYWRGYLALAQLRPWSSDAHHLDWFSDVLARCGDDADAQLHLHLALAKELEDQGRFAEAFGHLVDGKRAYAAMLGSSSAEDARLFDAIEAAFASTRPGDGDSHDGAIFVFGMPRSGTTLVDRILSSHPDVASGGELGHFGAAMQRMAGRPARSLVDIPLGLQGFGDWSALGRHYAEGTRALRGDRARLVDKFPQNFLFAGFIARALPNARLMHMRRDRVDTCLSNFRQLFSPDSPYHRYSFELADTARYFLRYERLMALWQAQLPGRILDVRYEDLVADQEGQTRRMLDYCGLDWSLTCLDFQHNASAAATASAAQVRRGMNTDSVDRWRRYGDLLDPLLHLLDDATGMPR
ncbi:MAG TPA: sulfotransferase [Lysobacter sp.]|nr:sulfotransferase [Lysobacter sp.]